METGMRCIYSHSIHLFNSHLSCNKSIKSKQGLLQSPGSGAVNLIRLVNAAAQSQEFVIRELRSLIQPTQAHKA